jgi:hypothetical protein
MIEISRLEMLSESIKNEIDELQSLLEQSEQFLLKSKRNSIQNNLKNIISNLDSTNGSIYGIYEELNANNIQEELENKCKVMNEILEEKLSYDDKLYLQNKI